MRKLPSKVEVPRRAIPSPASYSVLSTTPTKAIFPFSRRISAMPIRQDIFQDTWKIFPNLTFNLGVRYEVPVGWHYVNGTYSVVQSDGD